MKYSLIFFKDKLKNTDERSAKIGKNIAGTFIAKGGSLLVNLLLVPLTINFVSAIDYGIWLTLSSIIAWFGISDIGFGHGLRNKFAEAIALGNKKLARTYVSTTYLAVSVLMVLLWVTFFIFNQFLDWSLILNADETMKDDLSKVVLIVITFFVLQFIFKIIGTVLTANQEPAKASGFDFIANFFILGSIYLLMFLNIDGSLEILALLCGFFQLMVIVFASFWFYNRNLKEYRPSLKYVELKQIKSLMGLGIKFFIIQIGGIFVFQCTNIIITQLLGPEQVTVYNIAYRYFTIPMAIAIIIITPLWSAYTDAYTKGDYVWMRKVYKRLNYLTLIMSVVIFAFYFIAPFVYKIWIGDKVYIPNTISFVMMLNIIAATIFSTQVLLINGVGKIKLQLIVYIIFSFLFIPTGIFLCKIFELSGIIYANFLFYLFFAIIIIIQSNKLVNQTASGIWNK